MTMDREVARKRPAEIVARTARVDARIPTLPRREVITRTFHQRQELVKEVHRLARRREIGTTYKILETRGMWQAEVIRIREPGRRWGRIWAGLVGAVALLWAAALALQAIVAVLPYVIGGLVVAAVLAALVAISGRGGISISQSVNIK